VSEPLLTTREAAAYLHVRPETLLAWDRSGKLRGYRISSNALRWDPDEIEAFLRRTREDGPEARGEVSPAPSAVPTRGVVSTLSPAPSGGEHASRS
jgi:excisionase family DNA binding protein